MGASTPADHALDEIAVYAGLHRLGYLVEQAPEWLALNDDDEVLGHYATRKAAIASIVASAARLR